MSGHVYIYVLSNALAMFCLHNVSFNFGQKWNFGTIWFLNALLARTLYCLRWWDLFTLSCWQSGRPAWLYQLCHDRTEHWTFLPRKHLPPYPCLGTECPAGTYSENGTVCTACPTGRFSILTAAGPVESCKALLGWDRLLSSLLLFGFD